MLKIHHTAYPPGRIQEQPTNKIKDGGLWYSSLQNNLVEEANRIVTPRRTKKVIRILTITAAILALLTLINYYA